MAFPSTHLRWDDVVMDPCIYTWTTRDIPEPRAIISPKALAIITQAVSGMINDLKDHQIFSHDETDDDSDLGQRDRELARLRSIMWATREQFSERVSVAATHRNSLVPFNNLPMELAGNILAVSLSVDPKLSTANAQQSSVHRLKQLASVSTGFRRVVTSYPGLWTTITLDPPSEVSLKLRKSGSLPLDIFGEGSEESISLVTPHCHRWRSADIGFSSLEELIRAERVLLEEYRLWLESAKLRFTMARRHIEYMFGTPQRQSLLQAAQSDVLHYLEVEGVMLTISGALISLRHLEVHTVTGIRTGELFAMISACPALRVLILHRVGGAPEEGTGTGTGPQFAIDLPMLTTLELFQVSSRLCLAVIGWISGERLSRLRVSGQHRRDNMSQTLQSLLRLRGDDSKLSAVIANSGAEAVTIKIANDAVLEVEAYSHDEDSVVKFEGVGLFDEALGGGWTRSLNSFPYFADFAARLPRTELRLTEDTEDRRVHWSFDFLRHIPSVTCISFSKATERALYLFEEILAKRHQLADGEWVWVCPKLSEITFGEVGDQDRSEFTRRVERSLETRRVEGRAAGLPVISWWLPEDPSSGESDDD